MGSTSLTCPPNARSSSPRTSTPTSPHCAPAATPRTSTRRTRPRDPARSHGPAEAAAAAELADLHARHQQQRHHLHDLAHAHADWVSAEHIAEIHRALLDQLATQISAAHDAGDADLAATYLTTATS